MPLAPSAGSVLVRATSVFLTAGAVALFAGCGSSDSSGSGGSGGGPSKIAATDGPGIFEEASCASCHTLAAANAKGAIGPNLDKAKPPASEVVEKVTNGDGSMPSFKARMSAEQIQAVADYVASVEGQ